ncbi:hypothetical protein GCM10007094_44320 [Pseudovibrio japonicus]|uniref:IraD/Gp25-like domain-containing protein n=1 Tax=Pseudovibrio japonicus TaxID=366534 RepID=A0ABQ3ETN8_9HYPH|nr:hypothetical protein [Pseudovibrio japonicus]GHB50181.1 hypothetical protein GCM10007094_44320 [Pseudovibrio japonicus]
MRFRKAFLQPDTDETIESHVAFHVEHLLQSVSPEVSPSPLLENVASSNLCFGVPMNWALQDAVRDKRIRIELRERLSRFETRLSGISEINLAEDRNNNQVKFVISASCLTNDVWQAVELQTTLSRMDQFSEEGA